MDTMFKSTLIACLIIAFLYPVAGEVVKLPIMTDSSWKALDIDQPGWTTESYDDSWWEDVVTGNTEIENAKEIWYPGSIKPDTAYFRTSFDINSDSFISGKLYVGVYSGEGSIDLYLNDNKLGRISNKEREPAEIDILPYLKPGKNTISAKVDSKYHWWALSGLIRYNK